MKYCSWFRVAFCRRRVKMSAKKRRENTFRIDYANVPKKPPSEEVHQFVGETLGLKREDVMRIQYSRNLGVAFIKTTSMEVAQKTVEENDDKHELTVDGKSYKLHLEMEDGAVEVKLFNLSEDVTNDKIVKFLGAYGEVLSIREEIWDEKHLFAGLPTGVRVVRMVVKKNIASYVTIDSEMTHLAYYGQQQTCRYCTESVHNGVSCVQNKKLLVQKLAANNASYADVTKNPQSARVKPSAAKPPASKTLPVTTNVQVKQTTPAQVVPSTSGTMPPPANVIDISTPAAEQHGGNEADSWRRVTRKSGLQKKTDGNETDSSTSSKKSQKQPKKMRCDDDISLDLNL